MLRTKLTGELRSRPLPTSTRGVPRTTELWGALGGGGVTPPLVLSALLARGQDCIVVMSGISKHGYSTMNSIADSSLSYSQYGVSIKRGRTEDEYFNSTSDEEKEKVEDEDCNYQPAPGSPGQVEEDEEDDPLDAYMAELEKEAVRTGELVEGASLCRQS